MPKQSDYVDAGPFLPAALRKCADLIEAGEMDKRTFRGLIKLMEAMVVSPTRP